MNFDEMSEAVREAELTARLLDRFVGRMAEIVANRLQTGNVSHSVLKKLKTELANYNMHTGRWKE